MDRLEPVPVADLLATGDLGRLAAEARERRETTQRIRRLLPEAEGRELLAAHVEADGTLVLLMSGPAWAARVKYRAPDLGAASLKVRVAPRGRAG